MNRNMTIIFTPISKAATFVLEGVELKEVDVLPLHLRKHIIFKILYHTLSSCGLLKTSAYFRYKSDTLRRLKTLKGYVLCFDCCQPREYLVVNKFIKGNEKSIFFWNPLSNWSEDIEYINSFLRKFKTLGFELYSFDKSDCDKFSLKIMKNLNRKIVFDISSATKQDFYFVGRPKGRENCLKRIENTLQEKGYTTNFIFITDLSKYMSQYDNLVNSSESKCIVDIVADGQTGLTLRPFDAMFLKRKLLTNSKIIKQADFYHPDNIFVIEDNNLEGIEEFMEKPYHDIPSEIVDQYEINRWLKINFDV